MPVGPPPYRPHAAARALARRDPRFARLLRQIGPVSIPQSPLGFESVARAIAYQQLTGKAARTIWERVLARFDGASFTPREVLRKRPATLRAAGLSGAKVESLRDLARHVADGRLAIDALPRLPDDEVIAALVRVRGIGPWSAHMHLIFSLARPDVWPTGDYGVRKGLQRWLGLAEVPTPREAEALGEPFRPWRTVLAWSMWRIHELERWEV